VGSGHAAIAEPRRIGPVIHELERTTDPLVRQAGVSLDPPAGE